MASADRLESPYVIGGQIIQDGDYITLSIADLNTSSLSTSFGNSNFNTTPGGAQVQINVSSTANFAGSGPQNRSLTVTQPLDRTLYVGNDVYTLQPSVQNPTITFDNLSTSDATTGYRYTPNPTTSVYYDPPKSNVTGYTSTPGSSDVVMAPANINFVRAQNWYVTGYPTYGVPPDPSLTLDKGNGNTSAIQMLTNGSPTVTKTTTEPPLLCVELHDDDYMALRTPAGKYLHLLPAGQADSSTVSGPKNQLPQSLVLSFSSLPSSQYTAQWSVYLMNGSANQIVLQNRATDTCLTMDSNNRQVATDYIFYQLNPNVGQQFLFNYIRHNGVDGPARLYYNNYTSMFAQWWDSYIQQYYRLTGTSTIEQVNTNSIFTITKKSLPCNIGLNPLSPTCSSSSLATTGDAVAAILNICRTGNNFSTPACKSWAIANPDQAADAVLTYFQNHPNDTTFGGCQNIWGFRELIDYLSLTTPPTTLYAKCNLKQCQPDYAWKSTAQIKNSCVQQICAQGINFNGNVSDTTIDKITQNCNFNNGTPTSSDPTTPSGSTMTSPFQPFLDQLENIYNEASTKIGWTQIIIALIVFAVVLCVFLLVLPMIALDTSIMLSLVLGIASLFVI